MNDKLFKDEEELRRLFLSYENVRQIGEFNMLDMKRGCRATGCTPEQYLFIIKNYTNLHQRFLGDVIAMNLNYAFGRNSNARFE